MPKTETSGTEFNVIDAFTKLYGIFGNPVAHSLSPQMHNAAFKHLKINASYLAFEIKLQNLALAFEAIRSLDMGGVNITVPFKEEATKFVDEIPEDLDRGIDAINTVVHRDGRLIGYNTDAPGFLWSLKNDLNFNPVGKKVLLLGAGGSARAVAFALGSVEAEKVWIYNRTLERGLGLADYAGKHFPGSEFEAVSVLDFLKSEKVDLVVNTTSSGMKADDALPLDLKLLAGKPAVFDVIYAPAQTKLLKSAAALNLAHTNGLGMLAAQGALAFALWTGQKEKVRELMLETLKSCI